MSAAVSVQIDRAAIDRIKRDFLLMDKEVPAAISRATNRTLSVVETESSRQVRKKINLKATRIKKNFSSRKTTKNNLSGFWRSTGKPVGLIHFGARQTNKGVSVKVLTNKQRAVIAGAFIRIPAKIPWTGEQVFWRDKVNGVVVPRYPIERLAGPRIEDALADPFIHKAIMQRADETMQARLDAEANYILSKAGK